MGRRARNWCFTQFNHEEWDRAAPELNPDFRYMVFQTEICPKTGAPHIQGYIEFKKAKTFASVKNLIGRAAHLEYRKGTRKEARDYCKKADTRMPDTEPIELGEWTGDEERKRNDLNKARTQIQAHKSWGAVLQDTELTEVVCRHKNWAREVYDNRPQDIPAPDIVLYDWQVEILDLLDQPPVTRRVIWIWSHASGTGKSTFYDYCCARFNVLPCADFNNTLYAYDG